MNPDNSGEERYKSMSYQFLDKLLSSSEFRAVLLQWIDQYEPSLTHTDEDIKTRFFLKFLRYSVNGKDLVEKEIILFKKNNMIEEPDYETVADSEGLAVGAQQPGDPGAYLELRCENTHCRDFKQKIYVHLGVNRVLDYATELRKYSCCFCSSPVQRASGLGFLECKWGYKGKTEKKEQIEGKLEYSIPYWNFYEFHFHRWTSLHIAVYELNLNEVDLLNLTIPEVLIRECQALSVQAEKRCPGIFASHSTQSCLVEQRSVHTQADEYSFKAEDKLGAKDLTMLFLGKRVRSQSSELKELKKELKKYEMSVNRR